MNKHASLIDSEFRMLSRTTFLFDSQAHVNCLLRRLRRIMDDRIREMRCRALELTDANRELWGGALPRRESRRTFTDTDKREPVLAQVFGGATMRAWVSVWTSRYWSRRVTWREPRDARIAMEATLDSIRSAALGKIDERIAAARTLVAALQAERGQTVTT